MTTRGQPLSSARALLTPGQPPYTGSEERGETLPHVHSVWVLSSSPEVLCVRSPSLTGTLLPPLATEPFITCPVSIVSRLTRQQERAIRGLALPSEGFNLCGQRGSLVLPQYLPLMPEDRKGHLPNPPKMNRIITKGPPMNEI